MEFAPGEFLPFFSRRRIPTRNETFHIGDEGAKTKLVTYILDTYREDDLRPMTIVCPGGGFLDCSPYEGEPVALAFNRVGYHAAVLTYSTEASNPGRSAFPQPLRELADAVCLIRQHAEEWHVNPSRVIILGFSAGGQLCASYGNLWGSDLLAGHGAPEERRPNAVVLAYAMVDTQRSQGDDNAVSIDLQQVTGKKQVARYLDFVHRGNLAFLGEHPSKELQDLANPLKNISADTPATFLWTTFGDSVIDPLQDLEYAKALHKAGVTCELHVFAEGEHGLALADRTCARKPKHIDAHVAHWAELATEWLETQAFAD